MNSKSKCYYNDCDSKSAYEPSGYDSKCRKSGYNSKCKQEEEKDDSCPVIIRCNTGTTTTIPAATAVGTTFTIGTLNLNVSCLDNPCTALDFAANIDASTATAGAVSFQLQKTNLCIPNATPVSIGPAWTFAVLAADAPISTFNFSVCDCDNFMCNCNCGCGCGSYGANCYSYTIIATVTTLTATGPITISNPTIKTISTCSVSNCGC